jgi:uncharacterized protein (TIGR00255 family)
VLLSMTGFGDARWQGPALSVAVELRSVNNRFLKVSIRAPEAYQSLEPEIEKTVREVLKRGTVYVQVQVTREYRKEDFRLNFLALQSYMEQLQRFAEVHKLSFERNMNHLLALPGVVLEAESAGQHDIHEDWQLVGPVLQEAVGKLQAMRAEEGRKMARELASQGEVITRELAKVQERAPEIVADYRKRLQDKLQAFLVDQGVTLEPANLVKEVAIFAERTDINEEIVRLTSHLQQFHEFLHEKDSAGRKLDFLIQEMNREVNTIGSKANDIAVARQVVEMKGAIEKMRELIQNVE